MSKSPSLRRIQADIRELALDPSDRYHAAPLEDDMFEWHFTIRGADGTDFEGGVYHGRILLPPEYPFKPPNIVFLTPSGRFETGTKVCLSFSAYHPELWQPAWGIRLILEALISFLPTPADGAIGALDWSSAERKRMALKSVDFCCPRCGKVVQLLPKLSATESRNPSASSRFQKEIERLHQLQWEHEGKKKAEAKEAAENNEGLKEETDGSCNNGEGKNSDNPKSDESIVPVQDGESAAGQEKNSSESSVETEGKDNTGTAPKKETWKSESNIPPVTVSAVNNSTPPTSSEPSLSSATAEETATTPPVIEVLDPVPPATSEQLWLIDPVLQCTVVLLAVICYMLIRKGHALYEEIRHLESN